MQKDYSGPKIKNLHTKFFANNKPVELTDHKAGLFYTTLTEVSNQKSDDVSGSESEKKKRKFQDVSKSVFVTHL